MKTLFEFIEVVKEVFTVKRRVHRNEYIHVIRQNRDNTFNTWCAINLRQENKNENI